MISKIMGALFFITLFCSCKEVALVQDTQREIPRTTRPNMIFAATDDDNVVIGTARSSNVGEKTINIVSRLDEANNINDEFFYNFPGLSYAELPQNISLTQGRSGQGMLTLTFENDENKDITCIYEGVGAQESTAPTCGNNGYYYTFKYCLETKHFNNQDCENRPNHNKCKGKEISEYQPWVKVPAYNVGVSILSADDCGLAEVQHTMAYLDYNEYNGIQCGDIIEGDFSLEADLDCSHYPGFALGFKSDNVNIRGNGYKIIAPNGAAAILLMGDKQTFENFDIEANPNGIAILAYDTDEVEILNNTITNANIGINIMSYNVEIDKIKVEDNVATDMGEFGLYVNAFQHQETYAKRATVERNDFSRSGDYAIHLSIQEYSINGDFTNTIDGSQDGIYLAEGDFDIKNESFPDLVRDTTLFIYRADSVVIDNVVIDGHGGNGDQSEAGIHTYLCDEIEITNVDISNKDIGIKVATRYGVEGDVLIEDSTVINNIETGIMLQSYDGTALNDVTIQNNDLTGHPADRAIWEVDSITIRNKSFQNNQL